MKQRNSFSDLGLVVASSVLICIFIKSLLFGFTWGGILWIVLTFAYFWVMWKFSHDGREARVATSVFLVLSVLAVIGVLMFDKKAMPKMHAFEGTGDTIQDIVIEDVGPVVNTYEVSLVDSASVDSLELETSEENTSVDEEINIVSDSVKAEY